jgi:predicted MFS family arabinose efflux permease
MSLYTAAFPGVVPVGGLLAGILADYIGATRTVLVGGVICALATLYMARQLPLLRQLLRPIYARLGISTD